MSPRIAHPTPEQACPHCGSHKVHKNGILPTGGQRFMCLKCEKHFTLNGARNTYSEGFKNQIAEMYIVRKISARTLAKKYQLSTCTIVHRGKYYKSSQGDKKAQ
jgi:transposase-like protein